MGEKLKKTELVDKLKKIVDIDWSRLRKEDLEKLYEAITSGDALENIMKESDEATVRKIVESVLKTKGKKYIEAIIEMWDFPILNRIRKVL